MTIGDKCMNTPWLETWTCPECYCDHKSRVTKCEGCGTGLACTIEQHPVAVCEVVSMAEGA